MSHHRVMPRPVVPHVGIAGRRRACTRRRSPCPLPQTTACRVCCADHQCAAGRRALLREIAPGSGSPRVSTLVREELVSTVDHSVTGLIQAWSDGDRNAGTQLFARVYDELRAMSRRVHRRRRSAAADDTMGTTALVHEVYLRLMNAGELEVRNRDHFFAVAVRVTRQILSNYARHAGAAKRGAGAVAVSLDDAAAAHVPTDAADAALAARIADVEEALAALEQHHPRPCRVVECRFFGGLSIPETATVLQLSEATVKRDWAVAQAWLHRALRES
jgi:RNA polymerase sigma factor (TIGR02999 family)